jgi:hypothetical protein
MGGRIFVRHALTCVAAHPFQGSVPMVPKVPTDRALRPSSGEKDRPERGAFSTSGQSPDSDANFR